MLFLETLQRAKACRKVGIILATITMKGNSSSNTTLFGTFGTFVLFNLFQMPHSWNK